VVKASSSSMGGGETPKLNLHNQHAGASLSGVQSAGGSAGGGGTSHHHAVFVRVCTEQVVPGMQLHSTASFTAMHPGTLATNFCGLAC
jgi:hypothetical protein